MGTTAQAIAQALTHGEMQALGLSMPRLAPDWSPQGAAGPSFTAVEATMTLTASAHWAAPLDMSYLVVNPGAGANMPVTLVRADNSIESGSGVLLTMFDQSWLRLARLYTQVFETSNANRPEFNRGLPMRPVPKYIFFPGQTITPAAGLAPAWSDLGFAGDARFYDGEGLPVDPVATLAAFAAILTKFPVLQAIDLGASPVTPLPFTAYLATLAPMPAKTRIRVSQPDGTAYAGTHLTGLTAVGGASGLYELSAASAGLDAVSGSFTQSDHDRLLFGPSTSGRLMSAFTPPAVPGGVTLARDFYSLRVVQLDPYLIGAWPAVAADPAAGVQRRPAVRINENLSLLGTGNDVLGAIQSALTTGTTVSLAVAQAIDGNFTLPAAPGMNAVWPNFPAGVPAGDPNATLATALKKTLTFTANWVVATASDLKKADVLLTINGLPDNAWVRVYPRKFLPDANLARGDGEGRLVLAGGSVKIYMVDPFSLHDPRNPAPGDVIVPANATLMFDLAVVLPNNKARIYGGNTTHVGAAPAPADSFSPGTNACGSATYRGVSNAGILGLGTPSAALAPTTLAGWAGALTGESQPRDASRLPTMARRELLVAGSAAGTWTGVIGGGRIARETMSAQSRIGAPASLGGRETSVAGASTHGGILAYDIARHALRRSQNAVSRLTELADAKWNVPTEPTQVALGSSPSATNGTMAGALLQTVAPYCETPELYAAWAAGVNVNTAIDYVIANFIPSGLPGRSSVVTALQGLETTPAAPASATEDTAEKRIAVELEREVTSAYFGRRDAQWALKSAIATARHLIYIETPGFCSTAALTSPSGYAADLIALLKSQMASRPGLKVIICVPKSPDFAPGFEGLAAYEVQDRLRIVKGQTSVPVTTPLQPAQAIVFHPIGFPGRFSRVETNAVFIDDTWAMIGGASIRRRGLTMDGSSDLVFTDTLLENGRSAVIRDFRRGLMAGRLNITLNSSQPSYIALNEPATAFRVVSDAAAGNGLGDITSVWDGIVPGQTPTIALPAEQANPDGRDLDFPTAVLVAALGSASGV